MINENISNILEEIEKEANNAAMSDKDRFTVTLTVKEAECMINEFYRLSRENDRAKKESPTLLEKQTFTVRYFLDDDVTCFEKKEYTQMPVIPAINSIIGIETDDGDFIDYSVRFISYSIPGINCCDDGNTMIDITLSSHTSVVRDYDEHEDYIVMKENCEN